MIGTLGVFQIFQYYLVWFGSKEFLPKFYVNSGTSLLFPLSLTIVLQLYLSGSPRVFRFTCITLFAANSLAAAFAVFMRFGWGSWLLPGYEQLWTTPAIIKILGGTAILFFDIFVMIVYARKLQSYTQMRWSRVALPLLYALTIDSVLFSAIIAICDSESWDHVARIYIKTISIQLATKLLTGAIYASCLTLAFKKHDVKAIDKSPPPAEEFLQRATPRLFQFTVGSAALISSFALTGWPAFARSCRIMEDPNGKVQPVGGPARKTPNAGSAGYSSESFETLDDEPLAAGEVEPIPPSNNMALQFRAYLKDLPKLIAENHEGHQAAYYHGRRIRVANTKREILANLSNDPDFKSVVDDILIQRVKSRDYDDFGRGR